VDPDCKETGHYVSSSHHQKEKKELGIEKQGKKSSWNRKNIELAPLDQNRGPQGSSKCLKTEGGKDLFS